MANDRTQSMRVEAARPLSPHLQIYRRTMTMMMSIVHRITGVGLYLGTLLLAWYLIALAAGPNEFASVSAVMGSLPGRLVLFLFTWALLHHLLGGVRHFLWDMGWGLDFPEREYLAYGTLIGSIALTLLIWAYALLV